MTKTGLNLDNETIAIGKMSGKKISGIALESKSASKNREIRNTLYRFGAINEINFSKVTEGVERVFNSDN